jgi:hypothetical protein
VESFKITVKSAVIDLKTALTVFIRNISQADLQKVLKFNRFRPV